MTTAPLQRRFFVPEVVQTSAMDCGVACLKALLDGVGLHASYGRLREACQTDVDGTSIDTMEEVANQLGLRAEQIMIPPDHLFLPEASALPAIVVVSLPGNVPHFVVAWACHANRVVQVMDPATGRRWPTVQHFLEELYLHTLPVPAAAWREWAGSDDFLRPLRARLAQLGVEEPTSAALIDQATADPEWGTVATLDAATRLVAALVRAEAVARGSQAAQVLRHLVESALADPAQARERIPDSYWSVALPPTELDEEEAHLLLRGAVLVRVVARRDAEEEEPPPLSPELAAALAEKPIEPGRELLRLLSADGLLPLGVLGLALGLAGLTLVIEALLFRGLLEVGRQLATVEQRLGGMLLLLLFVALGLFLQLYTDLNVRRLGRRLETRLRIRFLEKIPRLGDRYFRSRPVSDMAERGHSIHQLRQLPRVGQKFFQFFLETLLTTAGMIWLHPPSAPLLLLALAVALLVILLTQPTLVEQDLRVRTHLGALGRYYLDALLGLVAVRTHRAERAIRREHESLLAEWVENRLRFTRLFIGMEAVEIVVMLVALAWLIVDYVLTVNDGAGVLLLAYWGLNLPFRARQTIYAAREYASTRNITLRLLEPLGAAEEGPETIPDPASEPAAIPEAAGLAIRMEDVSVRAAGHTILSDIHLDIAAGSQVAIVGSSGAGKTSLVGLLLGWHRPASGTIWVDGEPLDGRRLAQLRRESAWVDPTVHLWNRPFLENLGYGNDGATTLFLPQVIEQADLHELLATLPDGLQTPLGEGGGLVSGGEGQRVRLGRALLRPGVRLVILDEPFRGLGRQQRHTLLQRARAQWAGRTLLCITHDVSETLLFERVLVVEGGTIIEDGSPAELAQHPESRYAALLEAERRVQAELWRGPQWRALRMEAGQVKGDECTT